VRRQQRTRQERQTRVTKNDCDNSNNTDEVVKDVRGQGMYSSEQNSGAIIVTIVVECTLYPLVVLLLLLWGNLKIEDDGEGKAAAL